MIRKSAVLLATLAICAFIFNPTVGKAGDFAVGTTLDNFSLPDTSGAVKSLNDLKGKNGSVLVFLSAQCPVVKAYNERLNQIAAEYQAKGINFIGINSNSTEGLDWVKSHAAETYKFPMLIDKNNVLADKLGATVTPEVYYLDAKNVLLYHGAIDNDRSGKTITDTYLKAAFDSSLAGKPIEKTRANAFGCSIKRIEKAATK
ncbi:MAG TPA: thioredoxin family protein [Pyrinomonadaceae bacterium]|nr:thioredoxin family protein [Pyrinomonadaceae bacterium]